MRIPEPFALRRSLFARKNFSRGHLFRGQRIRHHAMHREC